MLVEKNEEERGHNGSLLHLQGGVGLAIRREFGRRVASMRRGSDRRWLFF